MFDGNSRSPRLTPDGHKGPIYASDPSAMSSLRQRQELVIACRDAIATLRLVIVRAEARERISANAAEVLGEQYQRVITLVKALARDSVKATEG